jgi:hypothetical protein
MAERGRSLRLADPSPSHDSTILWITAPPAIVLMPATFSTTKHLGLSAAANRKSSV